jgi:hypothetical protein
MVDLAEQILDQVVLLVLLVVLVVEEILQDLELLDKDSLVDQQTQHQVVVAEVLAQ